MLDHVLLVFTLHICDKKTHPIPANLRNSHTYQIRMKVVIIKTLQNVVPSIILFYIKSMSDVAGSRYETVVICDGMTEIDLNPVIYGRTKQLTVALGPGYSSKLPLERPEELRFKTISLAVTKLSNPLSHGNKLSLVICEW